MVRKSMSLTVASMSLVVGLCHAADQPRKSSTEHKSKPNQHHARIASKVQVEPSVQLSDREANEVALCGSRIIKHVVQARDDLQHQHPDAAAKHLAQATKLLAIIDNVLPRYKVTTEINSGELNYTDEDEVAPHYITLFEELERRDILTPIVQAKQDAENKTADPAADGEETPMAVTHADVDITAIRLDLSTTRRLLTVAEKLLAEKKTQHADIELMMLLSRSVLLVYNEVDLPLEEATDNLKLAEWEIKDGRRKEAKVALQVAIDQLKAYEEQVGEHHGQEVQALHQEIEKLTHELEHGEASEEANKEHAAKIENWWQRASKWFRKSSPAAR